MQPQAPAKRFGWPRAGFWQAGGKRIFDFAAALVLLVLALPLLLCCYALLLPANHGRVLFRQVRIGKRGRHFTIYKFRTMRSLLPGEQAKPIDRLTPVGRMLRRANLDELPQLINVLLGHMSLVGPRPLLRRDIPNAVMTSNRHQVRPGITGLVQVSGGQSLDWSERFALDQLYLANCTLLADMRILAITLRRFALAEGFRKRTIARQAAEKREALATLEAPVLLPEPALTRKAI